MNTAVGMKALTHEIYLSVLLRRSLLLYLPIHWTFFAASRRLGAVDALASRSAAHKAAPTVFVKEKNIDAMGTISNNAATTPYL